MFHRGSNSKRNGLLKPRKFKKRNLSNNPPPAWDSTTQDLSVHAASPEEVERRRIVRKSKNADAARRDLKAKKAGIPPSLMVSPAKLQLEMKKLALLRNVLYDQNDFTEVLRRADKTMTSVKGILHEKNYTNAYPHVTAAPGYTSQHPMNPLEQPSRLDALSESVMDGTALNENVVDQESDDDYCEESQFVSKLNCDHFLSILKDAMDNNRDLTDSTNLKTPEATKHVSALNGTAEVKRVQSFTQNQQSAANQRSKDIQNMLTTISQDATKVKRKLDVSANQLPHQPPIVQLSTANESIASSLPSTIAPPPRANISKCNMTYDDLQEAMKKVEKDMSVFDERRGTNDKNIDGSMSFGGGLAGFTKTLLDAITRLIGYVNEGELKHQETSKLISELRTKLNHVTAIADSLTIELKNEKLQNFVQQGEIDSLKKMLQQDRSEHAKLIAQLREDINCVKNNIQELKVKPPTISENKPICNDVEIGRADMHGGGDASIDDFEISVPSKSSEPMINPLLKKDMLCLLSALKSQDKKQAESNGETSNDDKSSHTITSVENQLSKLRLQHDAAERKIKNFIEITDIPVNCASPQSMSDIIKDLPSPTQQIDFDVSDLLGSEQQQPSTHHNSSNNTSINTMIPLTNGIICDASPPVIPVVKVKRQTNLPTYFDPDTSCDTLTTNSPQQPNASPLNAIRTNQLSLEDRIAELNRQHSEAQSRLHNLRRHNVKKDNSEIKVQISMPNLSTLETPKK